MNRAQDRAVVVGASMAGLLAARVLADHYRQVTLIDRDAGPDRRGVPQGRHIHALLAGGQRALEELLPGLTDELASHGAPVGDPLADTRVCFGGHWLARARSDLTGVHASRPFLERHVRERVHALPNVEVAPSGDVIGLTSTGDGRVVTGVRVVPRGDGAEQTVAADLVVDASGRRGRTEERLSTLGYEPAPAERVHIDLGYATCRYDLPAAALDGAHALMLAPIPSRRRGGALSRLEQHWMLTLIGVRGDHPPTDPEGFAAFARSLPSRHVAAIASDARPLGEPVGFRFGASVRRRYDRVARWPEGLVVVGDAVCSLNPVYGQGMSVAALHAQALGRHLAHSGSPDPRVLHREIVRITDAPWDIVTGGDLAFPGAEGRRPAKLRVLNAYLGAVFGAAARDAVVANAFLRAAGLVDPPLALLRPSVLRRVLSLRLRESRARPASVPSGR